MKVPKPRNTNSGWTHHRSVRIVWPNDFLGSVASALVMDKNSFASRRLNSDELFYFQENPQPGASSLAGRRRCCWCGRRQGSNQLLKARIGAQRIPERMEREIAIRHRTGDPGG